MTWGAGQDGDLVDFYRRLIAARRATPAVWRAPARTLVADDPTGLLAHHRSDGTTEAIVVLNTGDNVQRFRPELAGQWRVGLATDRGVIFQDGTLDLPPLSGAILDRQDRA
jgi:hypothetical protein